MDAEAGHATEQPRLVRLLGDPRAWFVAAIIGDGLLWLAPDVEASGLRFLDPLLLLLGFGLWLADDCWHFRSRVRLPRPVAAVVFVAAGVLVGFVYELTLADGGDGYGGLNEDTATSFLLFPGYYVAAAIFALLVIRRMRLDRRQAFFVGMTFATYEAVTVGLPALLSPFFLLAPFLVAYYAVVYALIVAFGILILPLSLLHPPDVPETPGRPARLRRALMVGVAAGLAAWVVYLAWALFLTRLGVAL